MTSFQASLVGTVPAFQQLYVEGYTTYLTHTHTHTHTACTQCTQTMTAQTHHNTYTTNTHITCNMFSLFLGSSLPTPIPHSSNYNCALIGSLFVVYGEIADQNMTCPTSKKAYSLLKLTDYLKKPRGNHQVRRVPFYKNTQNTKQNTQSKSAFIPKTLKHFTLTHVSKKSEKEFPGFTYLLHNKGGVGPEVVLAELVQQGYCTLARDVHFPH